MDTNDVIMTNIGGWIFENFDPSCFLAPIPYLDTCLLYDDKQYTLDVVSFQKRRVLFEQLSSHACMGFMITFCMFVSKGRVSTAVCTVKIDKQLEKLNLTLALCQVYELST